MSPEYAVDGTFSVKSDVFSFGVLVLEIISGKKNRGFSHPDHKLNLLGHVCLKVSRTYWPCKSQLSCIAVHTLNAVFFNVFRLGSCLKNVDLRS